MWLLATAFVAMLYSCVGNIPCAVLDGFSDAIVPNALPAEQKGRSHFELDARRAIASYRGESGRTEESAIRRMTLTYRHC